MCFFKRIAGQSKNWGKPVIKPKERGGGGNGQLTACVVLGGVEKTSSLQGSISMMIEFGFLFYLHTSPHH